MSPKVVRTVLTGLEVITGAMATYGGGRLLADASGFGVQEEWLHGSPFSSYQIPALGLLVFVAGGNLLAAALLWASRDFGILLSVGTGAVLMAFEIVETYSFGLRSLQQPLMFVIGLLIACLGAMLWRAGIPDPVRTSRSLHAH